MPGGPLPIAGIYPGDFNGDGRLDLLFADSGAFTVWFGDGTGQVFTFFVSKWNRPYPTVPSAVGDFNLDGHLDINIPGNPIQSLLGDGKGAFALGPSSSLFSSPYPTGFAAPVVADFNLDGKPDIFVAGYIYLGDGKGGFTAASAPPFQPSQTYRAITADFNRDGIPDVAYTTLASPQFLCDPRGTWETWPHFVSADRLWNARPSGRPDCRRRLE